MAANRNVGCANVNLKNIRIFPSCEEEEIVVSGMSGKFPNSRNINEYEYHLYNKIDMVDDDERRWKHFNAEIPKRHGKIYDLEKFDATFFGVHFKQAHTMDPQCRILVECAYEAVLDAGINPRTLRGSRTGVYVGGCLSETEKTWCYEKVTSGGFGITGCSRAMAANRISYALGLNGPSYFLDTACSSSMYALDCAFSAFRNGEIDAAIVGGINLTLHPYVTLQFARLGVLSSDGFCKPFDENANGYTRSEAVTCLFLQSKYKAVRIYATLVYSKTNCDGYKEEGITYPSGDIQERLLKEFYTDINMSPSKLGFIEAHSTGTVVGDPEECRAIDNVLCKARDEPLLIGSVKSNMGHPEPASGICSIVKVILAFEKGKIPPNINFKTIRKEIPALVEGRLKVVSEIQELKKPYVGVNSFGFGGANAHALFRAHSKEKINMGIPSDKLMRLVNWAGRTEDGVHAIFNAIESKPLDNEFLALLQNIQQEFTSGFVFHGYALYTQEGTKNAQCVLKSVQHYTGIKRPIVWVFSGMGSQWTEMGTSLMDIPLFRKSIERCHEALKPKGLDLIQIITSTDPTTFDNILHSFVGIAAIQIAIVDILKVLDIEPEYIIGHSVGELGCAYADGGFTPEQMILAAYSRGKVSLDIEKIRGSMAAIGLSYKNIVKLLPSTIEVACHNGPDSSTISGPAEEVTKFVEELKQRGIFAKEVPCSNIPYHSRYIAHMGPILLKYLKQIIPNPKKRSSKWLSSSVPKGQWEQPEAQLCSAEYHTNNLLSSVLFEETSAMLPSNALTIEIAPHGLLQAILKKSMPNAAHVSLTQRSNKNNTQFFLGALGKLFQNGIVLPIQRLYPKVEFPVSRGTPSLSSYIKWEHSEDWFVTKFENLKSNASGEQVIKIAIKTEDDEFLTGHVIDGRILVPATAYLKYVWEAFSRIHKGPVFMDMPVEFTDVRFLRATNLGLDTIMDLTVMIQYGTGDFEITDAGTLIVTGNIKEIPPQIPSPMPPVEESDYPILQSRDFYKELKLRGYHYQGAFRGVLEARGDGLCGLVKWDFNWVSYLDSLLQIYIVGTDSRNLMIPTCIQKMRINGKHHMNLVSAMDPKNMCFDVKICRDLQKLESGGVEIFGLTASTITRKKAPGIPVLERYQFISNIPSPQLSIADAVRTSVQLALENAPTLKMKIVEVDIDGKPPIIQYFQEALEDLPLITGDFMLFTSKEFDLPGIHVEDGKLSTQNICNFVISTNLLSKEEFVEQALNSMTESSYLFSREDKNYNINNITAPSGFHIITLMPAEDETYVLMQRIKRKYYGYPSVVVIDQNDMEFTWIEKIKAIIIKGPVIAVAQGQQFNGILGMVNCLRKEPEGHLITCVIIDDPNAPPFDIELPFYKNQLKLGLAINFYRNGKWGTYRHLQLTPHVECKPRNDHVIANLEHRGDLSSLRWYQGYLKTNKSLKVVYSSLNFRDIMFATGRLASELLGSSRLKQTSLFGFEFAGIGKDGKRYMGMLENCGVASYTEDPEAHLTWVVPEKWTLKEAATIPVVYLTVYYAFFFTTDIRKGKTILIHAGSGGIGLAAIRVALAYGLEVFTTVGTVQKKNFVMETFPQLKESNIGNSRDTSFEDMIKIQTKGKGVDFVLNSLAEDKLLASIRCLGIRGNFLEIGKFDLANNSKIGLGTFLKELSFHSVLADNLSRMNYGLTETVKVRIQKDIERGIVQPLPTTIFPAGEIEQAFRYMAAGKHVGKVLIEMRENDKTEFTHPIKVYPQLFFDSNLVYIIPGGLGGFGMELADWMVIRGARKLVLSSSRGLSKSYQAYRIRLFESYGAKIIVCTDNITTRAGCESLLRAGMKLGPIGGIFNLAVLLRDSIFENQTPKSYIETLAPKAFATKHLDELSRKMCPQLQHFVVFSSVSCGRGNAGQTNYGMANSVMERIIEQRVAEGLPGKAVQWGAVGEVGLVADMAEDKIDMEIGGTLQQRISSCLQELDVLLTAPDAIVASMVVAEKRSRTGKENIIETVLNIMSIRDFKTISMGTTLSEMGMDSLMAVEIKQTLEREFELFLTPQDLRSLTFQKLQEISDSREKDGAEHIKLKLAGEDKPHGMMLLLRNLGDEVNSHRTILPLDTKICNKAGLASNIIIPGLEGVAGQIWYNIALNLTLPTCMLQLTKTIELNSFEKITDAVIDDVKQVLKKAEPFYIIGYSFGSLIALEIVRKLEEAGYNGQLLLIDGAPSFLKKLACGHLSEKYNDDELMTMVFSLITYQFFPDEGSDAIATQYMEAKGWDQKMEKFLEYADKQSVYSKEYGKIMMKGIYNRTKMVTEMDTNAVKKIKSPITLIRPAEVSVVDIDEDYELSLITTGKVVLKFIEGNHNTMLENPNLVQIIKDSNPIREDDKAFEKYINN